MTVHAEKVPATGKRAGAEGVSRTPGQGVHPAQFSDHRAGTEAHRTLQDTADGSPQVEGMRRRQDRYGDRPQVNNPLQRQTMVQGGAYDVRGIATREPEASPLVIGPVGAGGGKRPPDQNWKALLGHGVDTNPDVDWEAVRQAGAERSQAEIRAAASKPGGPAKTPLPEAAQGGTSARAVPAFVVNERKGNAEGTWSVFEVLPGIGVEVMEGQERGYVDFIAEQLGIILRTGVGREALARFNPLSGGQDFRKVEDQAGPYRGLTVVISNPPPFKRAKFGRQPGRQIRTQKFSGRNERGQKNFGGATIPIIDFFNRAPEGAPDPIIDEGKDTGTRVTHRGVEGHPDFPDQVQPFDIVLYHELRHAMLEQTGISHALHQHAPPDQTDNIEEQLVVGLQGGRGLAGSENDYRAERGEMPLRGSYRAVGIQNDPQVDQTRWPSQGGPIVTIDQALELAGLGPRFTEKVVPDESK